MASILLFAFVFSGRGRKRPGVPFPGPCPDLLRRLFLSLMFFGLKAGDLCPVQRAIFSHNKYAGKTPIPASVSIVQNWTQAALLLGFIASGVWFVTHSAFPSRAAAMSADATSSSCSVRIAHSSKPFSPTT